MDFIYTYDMTFVLESEIHKNGQLITSYKTHMDVIRYPYSR